jgi:hypothetical protein
MIDWIFLDGSYAVLPIVHEVRAGAGYVASLLL